MLHRPRVLLVLVLTCCLFALAGCAGKKGVTVKGKVILPPGVNLGNKGSLLVDFMPQDSGGTTAIGPCSLPDGSFEAKMPKGKGVLPGKYKIVVRMDPSPGVQDAQAQADKVKPFNQKFDKTNTKLTYEVTADPTQSITIDLNTETVKKN
jgi:hypothetical protein